ncbi:MAG: 50S ribosomal protein L10 [Spirochaetes bacterium]|nr:50S ribosomal protein L10 [Spirochaetota bacterium]
MANQVKTDKVAEMKQVFEEYKNFVLTNYRGLTVSQMTDLRGKLNEYKVAYKVVKNTMARIALKEMGVEDEAGYFKGPTAVAFTGNEMPGAAKILVDFQKKSHLEVKGGFLDGVFYSPDQVVDISKLPGRSVLLSQIAGGMMGILSKFAGDMKSVLSTFALTLKAIEDKKAE